MSEYVSDPGDEIADAMVAFVADDARSYYLRPTVLHPDDPSEELKREDTRLRVLIVPVQAAEEKSGRGGQVLASESVNLILVASLEANLTRRMLSGLMYQIKSSLRGVNMAAWTWTSTETLTKYDADQIREGDEFVGAIQVNYSKTGGRG